MLSDQQQELIHTRGISSLHNTAFHSLYLGEPSLHDGLLSYFDGRVVTVCSHPLVGCPQPTAAGVRCHVASWACMRYVEGIVLIGPEPVDLRLLETHGFARALTIPRKLQSAELGLDCTGDEPAILRRRVFRRAVTVPLVPFFRHHGELTSQHFTLLERLYRVHDTSGYLDATAIAWPAALRMPAVTLIEAWGDSCLSGFLALHHGSRHTAYGMLIATNGERRVADFLYANMVKHAVQSGIKTINLDASKTNGQYNFKRKWGAQILVPPSYLVQWERGRISRRSNISWGPRLRGG